MEVPISSVPPQYLPPGGYTYSGGATTGTAPGESYETLGNSTTTYYAPGGGGGDGGSGSSNDCFVSSTTSGSLLGMGSLVAIALCGFLFLRRS